MKTSTLKYGILMFVSIALFFIVMNLIGLGHISELRLFNIVFVIYFTNRLAKSNLEGDKDVGYIENLGSLFAANTINVALSIVGFAFYVNVINPDYLNVISDSLLWMPTHRLTETLIALFFEGMAGNAVVSFGIMQYWKNTKHIYKAH